MTMIMLVIQPPSPPDHFVTASTTNHRTSRFLRLALLPLQFCFPPVLFSGQYTLPIFVRLQLRDHDLARRYAKGHTLAVGLLARDAFDVDYVLETIDRSDFSFAAFIGAADNRYFVVFANRH